MGFSTRTTPQQSIINKAQKHNIFFNFGESDTTHRIYCDNRDIPIEAKKNELRINGQPITGSAALALLNAKVCSSKIINNTNNTDRVAELKHTALKNLLETLEPKNLNHYTDTNNKELENAQQIYSHFNKEFEHDDTSQTLFAYFQYFCNTKQNNNKNDISPTEAFAFLVRDGELPSEITSITEETKTKELKIEFIDGFNGTKKTHTIPAAEVNRLTTYKKLKYKIDTPSQQNQAKEEQENINTFLELYDLLLSEKKDQKDINYFTNIRENAANYFKDIQNKETTYKVDSQTFTKQQLLTLLLMDGVLANDITAINEIKNAKGTNANNIIIKYKSADDSQEEVHTHPMQYPRKFQTVSQYNAIKTFLNKQEKEKEALSPHDKTKILFAAIKKDPNLLKHIQNTDNQINIHTEDQNITVQYGNKKITLSITVIQTDTIPYINPPPLFTKTSVAAAAAGVTAVALGIAEFAEPKLSQMLKIAIEDTLNINLDKEVLAATCLAAGVALLAYGISKAAISYDTKRMKFAAPLNESHYQM